MQNINELLPIGSVVLLEGADKPLMVCGVLQQSTETESYDFIGIIWPEGYIGADSQFFFQHEQIAKTLHTGLDNSHWQDFLGKLQNFYKAQS